MLKVVLENTSLELANGVPKIYKDHPTAIYIRQEGKKTLEDYLPEHLTDYKVEGSAERGQWADIPWVAIYNLSITDRASKGYYLVYLIPNSSNKIILGLAQSFQEAKKEFGKHSNINLDKQSEIMRMKIPEFSEFFSFSIPEIEISGRLNYRNGHVYHIEYDSTNLPSEEVLVRDLYKMLDAYETLFFRGGRDSDNFSINEQKDEEVSIEETYRKKVHYLIERPNNSQIKKIKGKLGYLCQGCDFDFENIYGELGKEYIEAHHLIPVSKLKKGESRKITETDFAVLCANCHRMIHRLDDSGDLQKLKTLIEK